MPDARTLFSDKDDFHLVKFLARHKPEPKGRLGNSVYQQLVENADDEWPWAKSHSWQSWRERYKKHQDAFDRKIRLLQKRQEEAEEGQDDVQEGPSTHTEKPKPRRRKLFTDSDDEHLAEFLASRGSDMGRLGTNLYKDLEAESDTLLWAQRHTSQSWRERYKKHQERIEGLVAKYADRKRVKKEKGATMPAELKEEARPAEASVHPPQAATSNSKRKEGQKETLASVIPSEVGQTLKSKETKTVPLTSTIPPSASIPALPKTPPGSTSNSTGKENQHNDEVQQDRSTHIEMRQERTTGPAKNQRVKSATPAPVLKASQLKAPPPPSLNGKGKQKEVELPAPRVQQTPISAPERKISIPPITIKSQEEASDGDTDMHSLFGSDDEELDELEDSQSQNVNKVPPRPNPVAPPPPKKDLPPERILVPSSSQMMPPPGTEKPPPPLPMQPLRKKAPKMKPRLSKKDENIFVSSDAEPSTPSPPRPAKSSPSKPYAVAPKIVEGPYRSHLKRVRSRIESDSDEAPTKRTRWNPESGSSHKKGEKMQAEERASQGQSKENIDPEVAVAPTVKKGATQLHHARKSASQNAPVSRTPASTHAPMVVSPPSVASPRAVGPRSSVPRREDPGNPIASSSRIRLSDIPPPQKATSLVPKATPASTTRNHPPAPKFPPPPRETPTAPTPISASTRRSQLPAPRPIADPLSSLKDYVARPHPSQSRNTKHIHPEASPRRDSGVIISPGGESEADFFNAPLHILSAGNNKGKEREYVLDVRPPRIDLLRESLNRRQNQIHSVSKVARTDSRESTASNSTTSGQRSRRESATVERRQGRTSVASEDAISAMLEWMAPLIDIAAEYNVPDSIAVKLFKRLISMEKTEVVLYALSCDLTEEDGLKAYNKKKSVARAKEALALFAQSKKIFEEDVSSGSAEEEMPSGLVLRSQVPSASASAVKVERRESGASAQAQVPSTKRRRSRPSLIIRRIPSDQDAVMSDYVPPKNSRAGQYARLQKQGRSAEAKEREMNRVLITETQTQYLPVRMHSPTVSPSPHVRLQVVELSQVMVDDDAMRIDENLHEERGHDEGQEEEEQEQDDDHTEDVFVDAEEEIQRDGVVMMESSEDEDQDAQADDSSVGHAVDDDEEQGEENEGHGDVEQPSDTEDEDEDVQAEEVMVEESQEEDDGGEEQEGEDEEGADDEEEAEQHDKEDNGIFGSRESEDEPEEQYHEERGTSPSNSDFDLDENHGASSPPSNEKAVENHHSNDVAEENDLAQNTGIVDEEDEDIYMSESLEMPYPGQAQRHKESQEGPAAEPEAEATAQSSSSHMQPSSLPFLLTFGSGGPDKNPAFADIAKAHRQLTFNATAENYQELKDFEEAHNDKSDLMRLWSIKWAKALMQHSPTDSE